MTKWTKISDEMPPQTGEYLLYTDGKKIRSGTLNEVGLFPHDDRVWGENITHWAPMPLSPDAPEEAYKLRYEAMYTKLVELHAKGFITSAPKPYKAIDE